jgi:hypothetical protein
MLNKKISVTLIVVGFVGTLVGYTNCSPGFIQGKGSAALSSAQAAAAACEIELVNGFAASYQPLLKNKCAQCHSDNGVAAPKLASSDSRLAYSTFRRYGPGLVDGNATSPTHAPGVSGSQNATEFAAAHAGWDNGMSSYNACLASQGPSGTPVPLPTADTLEMETRNMPEIYYNAGVFQTEQWDMNTQVTPVTAQFPGRFNVDVRVVYQTDASGVKTAIGYGFKNPRMHLLTGEIEVEVNGLIPLINGVKPAGAEEFGSAQAVVRGIDDTIIYNGEMIVPVSPVMSSDVITFQFRYLNARLRTDNPPIPPTPTIAIAGESHDDYTRQLTVAIKSLGNDSTARRWCVTASPTPIRSANDPCPSGYDTGELNGWFSVSPMSYPAAQRPMADLKTSGRALNSGDQVTVYYWVANADLKVNQTAGTDTIIFDKDAPTPVTLGSVTLSGTQIADLNGLTNTSDAAPVEWCVQVQQTAQIPGVNGCNGKWDTTKPTYVGLPFAGVNYISVFVRDFANNATLPQMTTTTTDVRSVSNTYGRISYTQLTTGGNAMSVF